MNDPIVERIRRCYLNDIENIAPFFLIGLVYVFSRPDPGMAVLLLRIFSYLPHLSEKFAFYAMVLVLKMIVLQLMTTLNRIKRSIYANPEDVIAFMGDKKEEDRKMIMNDPTVERIRRCHLNDIENIVPFFLIGIVYVFSRPDPDMAVLMFRIFATSRIFHTIAYLTPLPQPSRFLAFGIGVTVNIIMAVSVLRQASF